MLEKLLKQLQKITSTASVLVTVQDGLRQSRIYEFLREIGRAKDIHPTTPNYLEVQAMQTAWSAGYNQCLDDIMLFRERFLEADLEKNPPKMSFGGLDFAVFKEDLTKEEADAIRSGEPVPKLSAKHPTRKTSTRNS
jgi:hypothetical protein